MAPQDTHRGVKKRLDAAIGPRVATVSAFTSCVWQLGTGERFVFGKVHLKSSLKRPPPAPVYGDSRGRPGLRYGATIQIISCEPDRIRMRSMTSLTLTGASDRSLSTSAATSANWPRRVALRTSFLRVSSNTRTS